MYYLVNMSLRDELLSKYISEQEITDWFSYKKKPTVKLINSIFTSSAHDYKSGKISHGDFSLICVNLYFEAIVFLSMVEEKSIHKNGVAAIEAFADPHGHLLNPQGDVLVDKQNELLDKALGE